MTDEDLMNFPEAPWAREAADLVSAAEPPAIAHHSLRSYLFSRVLAEHEGMLGEVDPRLLYAATVLHDIGLRVEQTQPIRFEVDGADYAAAFLADRGFTGDEVDKVWEAIALHTSPGIAERRGPLAYLTRGGIGMDFGQRAELLTSAQAARIHQRFPRLHMVTALVDAIVAQCRAEPAKGPRYSLAGELTRERGVPPNVSAMELAAASAPWGE